MRKLAIVIISGLLLGAGALGATPAKADCIRAEVVVYWSDGTQQTVWPQSHCFLETGPLITAPSVSYREDEGNLPPGYPNGVRAQLWVPLPVP